MGLKAWRERTLARIDAAAERLDAKSTELAASADQQSAAIRERNAAASQHAQDAALRTAAARSGYDHEAMLARASAVGMTPPDLRVFAWWNRANGVLARIESINHPLGSGTYRTEDPLKAMYQNWVAQVRRAEAKRREA